MNLFLNKLRHILATGILFIIGLQLDAQQILNRVIPIDVSQQRLDNVLEILSNKGNFYFSYNSSLVRRDSLVSIHTTTKTVRQVLDDLFTGNMEYMESGSYVIIRRAPLKISLVTNQAFTDDKIYTVSGFVLDEESGERISNASIYEKQRLVSALTNEQGYFKLKLKSKSKTAALTVSKEFYEDTTVVIQPKYNQQISISITPITISGQIVTVSPGDYLLPDTITIDVQMDSSVMRYRYLKLDAVKVERTAMGKLLLSSKQRMQSINLKKYFTERAFQMSLTPGLSTHGDLSAQVVNKFSFNVFGGYTGGVNGFELAGMFNINKKDVKYAQIAGLFNIVGGYMKGVQLAGIHNTVLDTVRGLQMAGINNFVAGKFTGVQLGGIYNHVSDSVNGVQLGGIANFARKKVEGLQMAGIANVAFKEVEGAQIAGIINYTKRLKGVQIGLINISDTSEGYSIGLINIVLKGYHKLALSTNEVLPYNFAFKTGNARLYSILLGGLETGTSKEAYSFGYGIGKEIPIGKRFSINPEITAQHLYLGSWDYLNLLNKAHLNFNIKLTKWISVFGGPSYAVYYSKQPAAIPGYKFDVLPSKPYDLGKNTNGWIGWNAGIHLF
ncbi:MAG: carboxypeptidase-like regulatory domain-containing protein [Gemmatimonadaceae bacterium]|nr:carboxypeptidase-like regulatory domain-containing protein [Chitinophagaceae bacterium]